MMCCDKSIYFSHSWVSNDIHVHSIMFLCSRLVLRSQLAHVKFDTSSIAGDMEKSLQSMYTKEYSFNVQYLVL